MIKLHYFVLCPFSRKIFVALKEKKIDFVAVKENIISETDGKKNIRSFDDILILEDSGKEYSNHISIAEYLDEKYNNVKLIGSTIDDRAKSRRISNLFDIQFYNHVVRPILYERLYKFITNKGGPDSIVIREKRKYIQLYLNHLTDMLQDQNKWLIDNNLNYADIAVASQLSVLDYFGDISWEGYTEVKSWYALIKSRPSFRLIIEERISGFSPPPYYNNPDF